MLLLISRITLGSEQDAAEVAALDTQYQTAVKVNDYATMDRLLGNHFVLVIGTGHAYTKADLIGAARNAKRKWEHQEEMNGSRTVRVWGDNGCRHCKAVDQGDFRGPALGCEIVVQR